MRKLFTYLTVTVILITNSYSQGAKELQESFLEAEYFFMLEEYSDALNEYLNLFEKMPGNANLAYRIGICYLNISGMKNMAVEYLETAARNISAKHKYGTISEETAPYDALFELGLAYRINHQFDKAKETFIKYKEALLPGDIENISFINHEIETCDNARNLISKPVDFVAENLGPVINDEKDNFNPVISLDGKTMVFMVSLPFYNAIMYTTLTSGKWSAPVNIVPDLMVDQGVFVSSLSNDGKRLFLSQDDDFNSDIYYSDFVNGRWGKVVKLNKEINTKYWESHGYISEDGKTLIFASDRPGGYGGLDLYISANVNGEWTTPVNLGPEINSSFNEDRPSVVNNGKTIFFASQDHNNIGGYDIFRSDIQSNGHWGIPVNLGYPLNDTDDNILFSPDKNGKSGYVSTIMDQDGFGKRDIYRLTFK